MYIYFIIFLLKVSVRFTNFYQFKTNFTNFKLGNLDKVKLKNGANFVKHNVYAIILL